MKASLTEEEIVMDMNTALQVVQTWPLADQVEFVQRVWDHIVEAGWEPVLTDEQKAELGRRLSAYRADPTSVLSWEEVMAHLRRPR
jgi:putative addiction module component (TIGR02574 family)